MQNRTNSSTGARAWGRSTANGASALGWIVAAVLAGVMIGGGFQGSDQKIAVVDFASVVEKSDYFVNNDKQLNNMKTLRESILEFLFTNKVATAEQALRFRDLSLKEAPTPAEKQELDNIKTAIINADKDDKALSTKPNPTPDETARLRDYGNRKRSTDELLARWQQDFERELQQKFQQVRSTAIERARQSVSEVGKSGGFSVILRSDVAPYGANDVTEAALRAMNAKR